MIDRIGHVTILVKDQDEAARFYTEKMGFVKRADTVFGPATRWVTLSPKDHDELELTLVKAETEEALRAVGRQAGDHVFLTMETSSCYKDFELMKARGVKFHGEPEEEPYGIEVVFEDLYGNLFDLIERRR